MDKLAHSVILYGWSAVAKALRELKKKKHTKEGFYPVVEDLGEERFSVRVYRAEAQSPARVAK